MRNTQHCVHGKDRLYFEGNKLTIILNKYHIMRNLNAFGAFVLFVLALCSCSQKSKLESMAKDQLGKTFKEMAKDPESVKLSNFETVYLDDSLCIIHVDFSAKNGFGNEITNRCEYIYISSNDKNYESYQDITNEEDAIFVSQDKYNKGKKGTIYESLDYEPGLRYLAATYVNGNGREAGNSDGESCYIPVPTGTGSWEMKSYKDEFGEESASKYLVLKGNGVFSNSATTNSKMTAYLFMDKTGDFSFKLIEYNSSVVKSSDSYDYRIKDSEGEVYEMTLYNGKESGQMSSWSSTNKEAIKKILNKGGVITVSVRERYAYSTPDTYLFKLDVTGYNKAASFL